MRRLVLSLVFLFVLAACVTRPEPIRERASASAGPFTSALATLHDFELDGVVYARPSDVTDPKVLVVAQLTYAVGQLNGERAVGRYERLVVSSVSVAPHAQDTVEIRYHAKLPVAWASGEPPSRYTFVLPARAAPADQVAFEEKYGESCIDPSVGVADPGSMFLLYRPHRDGCSLQRADVVTFEATTSPSTEETTGKYPEYDRVWDDDVLQVVAIVSRDIESAGAQDEGIQTYAELVHRAQAYLAAWQTDAALRTDLDPAVRLDATTPRVTLGATAADGRRVAIDVMLAPHNLESGSATFDPWFDALTPTADLVLYNGHAGLGTNIRTLSQKGSFRAGKYVVWAINGCDTFAYLDRTLADRRAVANPDDPTGTKYMDLVSNVMPGHFKTAPGFAMTMLDAFVTASDASVAPKTYAKILEAVDGEQVAVVTGEEDNAFDPAKQTVRTSKVERDAGGPVAPAPTTVPPGGPTPAPGPKESGCAIGAPGEGGRPGWTRLVLVAVALAWLRGRARSAASSSRAGRSEGDTPPLDRSRPDGGRSTAGS